MPPPLRRALRIRRDRDFNEIGFEFSEPVDEAALRDGHSVIRKAMQPAGWDMALLHVTNLRLATRSRDIDQGSMAAQLNLYADRLADYPADIIEEVCGAMIAEEIYFPAVAEIIARLEARVRRRRWLDTAIRDALGGAAGKD